MYLHFYLKSTFALYESLPRPTIRYDCQLDRQNSVPNRSKDSHHHPVQTRSGPTHSYTQWTLSKDTKFLTTHPPLVAKWRMNEVCLCFYDMAHKHRGYFNLSSPHYLKPQSELNNKTLNLLLCNMKIKWQCTPEELL